jgi:hypothetical protein
LDDRFTEHPKVDGLTDAAFRLHVAGICYCNRHRTDGKLAAATVPRLVPRFRRAALAELVSRGIWYDLNGAGEYEIHDYLQWNDSRAEIEEFSQKQRKNAQKRWDG